MNLKLLFIIFLLGLGAMALFPSCKELIEPSIEKSQIVAEAPGDKLQTTNYTVPFWWDEVGDALQYRLQVVSPKFDSIASLVVDTVVKTSKFSINLSPGNYQWRVRAENGSSKTAYSTARSFTVLSSTITTQKVILTAPANNFTTNTTTISFAWGSVYGATVYHLEIDTASFADETKLVYDKTIPGQQINVTLSKDQVYQWRVRAENDTAKSLWSAINTFTFDHTPPSVVTPTLPADKQIVSTPVALQWGASSTASKYRLYLYKSDGSTAYSSSFPMLVTATSYTLTSGTSGETIYWKIVAIDAFGNESAASTTRSFIIQ